MKKLNQRKIILLICFFILIIFILIYLKISGILSFEFIKTQISNLSEFYNQNPYTTIILFFFAYIIIVSLSIPEAAILTILAGAIFGFIKGVIIVSFASSIGATNSAAISRYIFRDYFEKKLQKPLKIINQKLNEEGPFYLFSLRMILGMPYFIINATFGLTKMKLKTFYIVSQIGMLAGTMIYVNAGVQISQINSINDIISLKIFLSILLIELFPIISKNILKIIPKIKKTK